MASRQVVVILTVSRQENDTGPSLDATEMAETIFTIGISLHSVSMDSACPALGCVPVKPKQPLREVEDDFEEAGMSAALISIGSRRPRGHC